MNPAEKPLVLITGAAGDIGSALAKALAHEYRVVGLDRPGKQSATPLIEVDLGAEDSVRRASQQLRSEHGSRIASVIHLAAYFDFTGEDNPPYEKINVAGTRALLRALQEFEVEQFLYSGTMLVHEAGAPGERIGEDRPLAPSRPGPRCAFRSRPPGSARCCRRSWSRSCPTRWTRVASPSSARS